mgnify:CR=1 FL=1
MNGGSEPYSIKSLSLSSLLKAKSSSIVFLKGLWKEIKDFEAANQRYQDPHHSPANNPFSCQHYLISLDKTLIRLRQKPGSRWQVQDSSFLETASGWWRSLLVARTGPTLRRKRFLRLFPFVIIHFHLHVLGLARSRQGRKGTENLYISLREDTPYGSAFTPSIFPLK